MVPQVPTTLERVDASLVATSCTWGRHGLQFRQWYVDAFPHPYNRKERLERIFFSGVPLRSNHESLMFGHSSYCISPTFSNPQVQELLRKKHISVVLFMRHCRHLVMGQNCVPQIWRFQDLGKDQTLINSTFRSEILTQTESLITNGLEKTPADHLFLKCGRRAPKENRATCTGSMGLKYEKPQIPFGLNGLPRNLMVYIIDVGLLCFIYISLQWFTSYCTIHSFPHKHCHFTGRSLPNHDKYVMFK